jgi:hypothetical protein
MDGSLYLLLGRARASVLHVLHRAAEENTPLHLREIARRASVSPSAVQYELRMLNQLDMLKDVGTFNRPLYELNRDHNLFSDMHAMFTRRGQDVLLRDDAHFASKRIQQRKDHSTRIQENSSFLRQWGTLADKVKVA